MTTGDSGQELGSRRSSPEALSALMMLWAILGAASLLDGVSAAAAAVAPKPNFLFMRASQLQSLCL